MKAVNVAGMHKVILLRRDGGEVALPFEFASREEANEFVARQPLPVLREDLRGWLLTEAPLLQ